MDLGLNMSMLGDLGHLCGILGLGLDMDMRFGYDLALDLVLNGLWNSVYCLTLGFEFHPSLMAWCQAKGVCNWI